MSDNNIAIRLQCLDDAIYCTKTMLVTLSHYFEARLSDRWLETFKDSVPEIFLHFAKQDVMHVLQLYGDPKYVPQFDTTFKETQLAHKMRHLFVVAQFLTLKKDFQPVHWMYVDYDKMQFIEIVVHDHELNHSQFFYTSMKLWCFTDNDKRKKNNGDYVEFIDEQNRTIMQKFVTHDPIEPKNIAFFHRLRCEDSYRSPIRGEVCRCPKVYFEQ